jgi:hypothetical protein
MSFGVQSCECQGVNEKLEIKALASCHQFFYFGTGVYISRHGTDIDLGTAFDEANLEIGIGLDLALDEVSQSKEDVL